MPTFAVSAFRVAVLVGLAFAVTPKTSAAFCRQKTCQDSDCPVDGDGCVALGEDLFYDVPCLSFAVDEGSAEPLGVSDDEMIQIVAEAFQTWRDVQCPEGGNPSFEVQSVGVVPASGIFFCKQESLNVSVWTLNATWKRESTALGYTTTNYVVDTGEVYDSDVELNLERIASVVSASGDAREALLAVALHEAGHFLGLAHSNRSSAVMAASYRDLRPRDLTADDIEGICSIYPPRAKPLVCSEPGVTEAGYDADACAEILGLPPEEGACSVRTGSTASSGWFVVGGLLLGLWRRRRTS